MEMKKFTFNPFSENTYVLWVSTGEGVIVDPGNFDRHESGEIIRFVEENGIRIQEIILTHAHIDHIFGCAELSAHFGVGIRMHKADLFFLERAEESGMMYGFPVKRPPAPTAWFSDGDIYNLGAEQLLVRHTPGHSPGSVSFIDEKGSRIISGDVLFKRSIGRTDLPMGDMKVLLRSIREVIFAYDDAFEIHSGHGPVTTIGEEKAENPFLKA